MFSKLYQNCLKLASHKSSKKILAIVAFVESSFFPIPPDIMIVPMVIAKKTDYLKIFAIASIFSALGGLLGYLIGSTFIDLSMNLIQLYGYEERVLNLKNDLINGSGFYVFLAALFLAGFTPLPFKVFTITSGMIGFNIIIFFFICLASRGLRFFVLCYLTYKFGHMFDNLMKKEGTKLFVIAGLIIITFAGVIYFSVK